MSSAQRKARAEEERGAGRPSQAYAAVPAPGKRYGDLYLAWPSLSKFTVLRPDGTRVPLQAP